MRVLLTILLVVLVIVSNAQTRPAGNPQQKTTFWHEFGYVQPDSGLINGRRDTLNFFPRFSGTQIYRPQDRNIYFYDSTLLRWFRLLKDGDVSSTTASNGLSKVGDDIVLGQDVSAVGSPGRLLSNREIPFNGFNLHFSGAIGNLKVGDNAGTSTARMQISSTTAFSATPYQSLGPLLSNSIYSTLHTSDTVTVASEAAIPVRGYQMNRNLVMGANGNVNLTGKNGSALVNILRVRDTVTLNASGHNNWYANSSQLSFLKAGGYSGRSSILGGVDGISDAPNAFTAELVIGGSSGANNFHFYGDWVSLAAELAHTASTQDTIEHYMSLWANSNYLGRIEKAEYLRGFGLATSTDSLWSIYFSESSARGYHEGNLGLGVRVPTNKLDVAGTGQFTDTLKLPNVLTKIDTTANKPLAIDANGNVFKMSYWPGSSSGGSGINNTNIGSGFRVLSNPSTQTLRTLFTDVTLILDSISNTNALTFKVDSNILKDIYLPLNLNDNKLINQAGNNIYFTGGGQLKADSINLSITETFSSPTSLLGVGDSYIAGFRPCTPDTIFFDRLTDIYNLTPFNYGVSSTGIWRADSVHNYRVNPGHSFMSFVWAGFNDIRRGGITNDTTYRKIIWGMKSIISNHFLKSYVFGGVTGSGVTRFGTWITTYTAAAVGGKSPNNGAYTNILNDSITYTFTDTTVVLSMIGGDGHAAGYNMGNFEIFIDNVSQGVFNGLVADGISDGFNDNARSPMTFIFTGLSNAAHKLKVVNLQNNYVVVDYFGHLVDASSAKPLLIAHAPYNNVAGFAVSPSEGSVAAMDKLNNQIDSMVAVTATAYPIFVLPTNSYLDTLTGLCTDNIHPNNTGDIQITNGALSVIPTVITSISNGSLIFDGGHFKGKAGGVDHVIPWLEDVIAASDSSNFIINQTAYDQEAAFRINGASTLKNSLTVGSSALADGSTQLKVTTSATTEMRVLGFTGQNYWQSVNTAGTTGVAFNFGAGAVNFGSISGGVTTTYAILDNSALNKFTVTGNALINSAVRLGTTLNATNAARTVGSISNLPYDGFYNSAAATNQKIWDFIATDSAFFFRTVNDAFATPDSIFYAVRSGITPLRFIVPKATLNVGYFNVQGKDLGAYFNRTIGANKDSIEVVSSITSQKILIQDTLDGKFKRISASTLMGNTLYTGDGTLSGARTVTMSGNSINFSGGDIGIDIAPLYDFHIENSGATQNIISTGALGTNSGGKLKISVKALPTTAADVLGNLEFTSRNGANDDLVGAQFRAIAEGAWTATTTMPTAFVWRSVATSTMVEKMRLNSTGNLGIGITNPTGRVHPAAGTTTIPFFRTPLGVDMTTPLSGSWSFATLSSVDRLAFSPAGTTYLRFPLMNDVTPTAGGLIQGNGSNFTLTALGTAGQVWTVNAGATAGEWQTPAFVTSNIYTANGILTGDRQLSGAELYDLRFINLDTFYVSTLGKLIFDGAVKLGVTLEESIDVTSAGTVSMTNAINYVATGTTATFSLPTGASALLGRVYKVKNRGSGNLTVDVTGGGIDIFDSAPTGAVILATGEYREFIWDGVYWLLR